MLSRFLGQSGHWVVTLAVIAATGTLMGTGHVTAAEGLPVIIGAAGIGTAAAGQPPSTPTSTG